VGSSIDGPVVVRLVSVEHMDIYKVASDTQLRNLPRSIGLKVQKRVASCHSALHITLEHFKSSHGESKLMRLSWSSIYYQNSLVRILVPCEDLGSRVDQCSTTKIVVANMDLRIATVQGQRSAVHLRNSDVTKSRSRDFELVARGLERAILSMTKEVEPSAIAKSRCDSQVARRGPGGVRSISACRSQIRWADLEEVRLYLLLRVLLAIDAAILSDWRGVVVRSVAARVTKIAPVRTAPCHVKVQNCDTEAVQVLVEYSFERGSCQSVAFIEPRSAPGVEATSLKLNDRVGCGGALLLMQVVPAGRKVAVWPCVWVRAIKTLKAKCHISISIVYSLDTDITY
jgi:hypothetical protein